ncbi:MAG: VpaChn25_0724 family phage protein [Shimia sp.]
MHPWPVHEVEQERRRLEVLQYLAKAGGYRAQEALLTARCNRVGIPTTVDQMAACTAWLVEHDLISLAAEDGIRIARITGRGREVSTGQARHPGVMPPDP